MGEAAPGPVCGICGAACPAPFRAPTAELAPDLDLRPGEPARSTLKRWVATCGGCGASAPELARLPGRLRAVVEGVEYKGLAGRSGALPFLRWAMLCEAMGEAEEAGQAVLEAAWVEDDAGRDAVALRRRAAALWGAPATGEAALRLVDVLRRAGDLATARGLAEARLAQVAEETDAAVLRFQLGLIEAGDGGRHMLSSALRPPARRPHVTHGRAEPGVKKGFWQRLTGG